MNRNWTLAATFAVIIGAMLWLAAGRPCPLSRSSRAADAAGATAAPASPADADFTVRDLEGNVVRTADLQGKAVILNFWATWCPPCRAEIPDFIDLQKKYGPQGLRIVGIAMDDAGRDAVAQFVRQNGINYPVAMPNEEIARRYGTINVLPTTYYIGRDGQVVQLVTGLIGREQMESNVQAALATRIATAPPATNGSTRTGVF